MHYASQWKGPTDKDSYINREAQMGVLVEELRFLWVMVRSKIMQVSNNSHAINTTPL